MSLRRSVITCTGAVLALLGLSVYALGPQHDRLRAELTAEIDQLRLAH